MRHSQELMSLCIVTKLLTEELLIREDFQVKYETQ